METLLETASRNREDFDTIVSLSQKCFTLDLPNSLRACVIQSIRVAASETRKECIAAWKQALQEIQLNEVEKGYVSQLLEKEQSDTMNTSIRMLSSLIKELHDLPQEDQDKIIALSEDANLGVYV